MILSGPVFWSRSVFVFVSFYVLVLIIVGIAGILGPRCVTSKVVGCVAQLVERRSSAGVISLSYARLAAEGWPFMRVNRLLQVSQLGQLSLSFFGVDKLSSQQLYRMCSGSDIWWVLTRLCQVQFINHWAPFVACHLLLNPSVYSAALHGGCCVSRHTWRILVVLDRVVCLQSNKRLLLLLLVGIWLYVQTHQFVLKMEPTIKASRGREWVLSPSNYKKQSTCIAPCIVYKPL